jgi:hypothetical protein
VAPGETVDFVARLHLPERLGRFRLTLDMVDEQVAWFEQCGSPTAEVQVHVAGWPDSRAPHRLQARIEVLDGPPRRPVTPGSSLPLRLRIANTGDTRWLAEPEVEKGLVRVGFQMRDAEGSLLERDYHRAPLPRSLDPGETVEVETTVPAPPGPGRHTLALDLVAELVCWFEQQGSPPVLVEIETAGEP